MKILAAALFITILTAVSAWAVDGVADFKRIFEYSERYLVIDEKLNQEKTQDDSRAYQFIGTLQTEEAARATSTREASIADKLSVWLANQPDKERVRRLAPISKELAKIIEAVAEEKWLTNIYDSGEIVKTWLQRRDLRDITPDIIEYIETRRKPAPQEIDEFHPAASAVLKKPEKTPSTDIKIQIGAFKSKLSADGFAAAAAKAGIKNTKVIRAASKDGSPLWRVRAICATLEEAQAAQKILNRLGIENFIAKD